MGGPRAVDDVVVRGIEWSPVTWVGLIALSVVAAVVISLVVCRTRSRRDDAGGAVASTMATAGAGGPGVESSASPLSDAWRRGERPVTERLAEVRRLQGAGLITTEQADRRVREILAEV